MSPRPRRLARLRMASLCLLIAGLAWGIQAVAGHESPFYPSFYPQEVRIESMDPVAAGAALQKKALHAYIGTDPFSGGAPPAPTGFAESFGSYLVATFNPVSAPFRNAKARCAAGRTLVKTLAEVKEPFVLSPYPVTSYHPDYLYHFDLVQTWKNPPADRPGKGPADLRLKIRAHGKLAQKLVGTRWPAADTEWDATVEEVEAPTPSGWLGPPWGREGWFHAYALLAGSISDSTRRQRIEAIHQRLVEGAYADSVEKVNLERTLVSQLTHGCERIVIGYTTRRTVLNDDFSQGVENVAVDAFGGPIAPIFIRTVKLKDFPWNGSLRIGMDARPDAAWNPIAGFTDPMGRLIWFAVGDPALFPAPSNGSWVPSRVTATVSPRGSTVGPVEIPPDALIPEPAGRQLRPVGPGKVAKAKVAYKVPLSLFHDGTRMAVADLIYPFLFAHRWGTKQSEAAAGRDPAVAESTGVLRKWLAGLKVVNTEQIVKDLGGGVKLEWQVPVIEVYLHHTAIDLQQVASVAPPWSSLPWHLVALMEEAVSRGAAAFSEQEARRLGAGWLDLVRDPPLQSRLVAWAEEFERTSYIPEALKTFVRPEEARKRWAALRQFHQRHRHLFVTNGPYRLEKWSAEAVTLQVFRDPSYPLGVGAFDAYVLPPKAHLKKVEPRGHTVHLVVEMEKAVRAQRTTTWAREALTKDAMAGGYPVLARCHYIVLSADGKVRHVGAGQQAPDGTFRLDLKGVAAGSYSVLTAVYLNGNAVHPDVKAFAYRAPSKP